MTTEEKIIKNKLGLLRLAEQLGNMSQACEMMGYSRDSFNRFKELYDKHGAEGLREIRRYILYQNKKHPKEMGEPEIQAFLIHLATERNVAASTQNQALSALIFLYRNILRQDQD